MDETESMSSERKDFRSKYGLEPKPETPAAEAQPVRAPESVQPGEPDWLPMSRWLAKVEAAGRAGQYVYAGLTSQLDDKVGDAELWRIVHTGQAEAAQQKAAEIELARRASLLAPEYQAMPATTLRATVTRDDVSDLGKAVAQETWEERVRILGTEYLGRTGEPIALRAERDLRKETAKGDLSLARQEFDGFAQATESKLRLGETMQQAIHEERVELIEGQRIPGEVPLVPRDVWGEGGGPVRTTTSSGGGREGILIDVKPPAAEASTEETAAPGTKDVGVAEKLVQKAGDAALSKLVGKGLDALGAAAGAVGAGIVAQRIDEAQEDGERGGADAQTMQTIVAMAGMGRSVAQIESFFEKAGFKGKDLEHVSELAKEATDGGVPARPAPPAAPPAAPAAPESPRVPEAKEDLSKLSYEELRLRLSLATETEEIRVINRERMIRAGEINSRGFVGNFDRVHLETTVTNTLLVNDVDSMDASLAALVKNWNGEAMLQDAYRKNPRYNGAVYDIMTEEVNYVRFRIAARLSDEQLRARDQDSADLARDIERLRITRLGLINIDQPTTFINTELGLTELDDMEKAIGGLPGMDYMKAKRRRIEEEQERQRRARPANLPPDGTAPGGGGPVKGPENGNGRSKEVKDMNLKEIMRLMAEELGDGQWRGALTQREVNQWTLAHEGQDGVSLVKAQVAMVDWLHGVAAAATPKDKVEAVVKVIFGPETLEAIESDEAVAKARDKVLEIAGFDFTCMVENPSPPPKMRRVTGKDIYNGNLPKGAEFAKFLDKNKFMLHGVRPVAEKPNGMSFWDLQENDLKLSLAAIRVEVAKEMKVDPDSVQAASATITALRYLEQSGLLNMFSTNYKKHPFIFADMTRAMFPEDGYLNHYDSNDPIMADADKKPGHYRFISTNRYLFKSRNPIDMSYQYGRKRYNADGDPELDASGREFWDPPTVPVGSIPGLGVGYDELVFPPERFKGFVVAPKVLSGKGAFGKDETLVDRWIAGQKTDRTMFFGLGPMVVEGYRRAGAVQLWEALYEPIPEQYKTDTDWLYQVGEKVKKQLKTDGIATGKLQVIRKNLNGDPAHPENLDHLANREYVNRLRLFYFMRGNWMTVDDNPKLRERSTTQLDAYTLRAEFMALGMEGWIVNGGQMTYDSTSQGPEQNRRSDNLTVKKTGWLITISGEENSGDMTWRLDDPNFIAWVRGAGVDYPVGDPRREVQKMLKHDKLTWAYLTAVNQRRPDPTQERLLGLTVKDAFLKRRQFGAAQWNGGIGWTKEDRKKLEKWQENNARGAGIEIEETKNSRYCSA